MDISMYMYQHIFTFCKMTLVDEQTVKVESLQETDLKRLISSM